MITNEQSGWPKNAATTSWWPSVLLPPKQVRRGPAMAVTQKNLRSAQGARRRTTALPQRLYALIYAVTLILAAIAIYIVVGLFVGKAHILLDDLRYGRPRTTQLDAFVGHEEAHGQPTHMLALNLNRQVSVIELPGGDATKMRTITGPYLFGADEDLTPLLLSLRDMD